MAWKTRTSTTTAHTCGGPVFGRIAPRGECRRCDEIRFGAPVVQRPKTQDQMRCEAIRAHDCSVSRCGPVCTFGDW